jgi:peptide/nickel transport system ATP-binding protein
VSEAAELLNVESLCVDYHSAAGWTNVINDVSFSLRPAEILGIAGESGSGKSTLGFAVLGHRRAGSRVSGGKITFQNRDLLSLRKSELRAIRGNAISFVPQNPTTSLSPSMKVGRQIAEILTFHRIAPAGGVNNRVVELLTSVGLPEPARTANKFPYQLSGGQQQRVLIAMAMACDPALIILDEPTTGLDVTTQARILRLIVDLRDRVGSAFIYVSHDLGALSSVCDRIGIMYAGELVEIAPSDILFSAPAHPYTRGLIGSVPRLDRPPDRSLALQGILRRDQLGEGCRFEPRCRFSDKTCKTTLQSLQMVAPDHAVACHRWQQLAGHHE